MINSIELNQLLSYKDGKLYWKIRKAPFGFAGAEAGTITRRGYCRISIDGVCYLRHNLVWFMHKGSWPVKELDHLNRIKGDDRIENLRECSRAQNMQNAIRSRKLPPGVHKHHKRFRSCIQANGTMIKLGSFETKDEAAKAYREASLKYHGEFSPFHKEYGYPHR